jgi:hypothetical protein
MNNLTLTNVQQLFPKHNATHCSVTGHIPVDFVENNKPEFDAMCIKNNLRRKYRGPHTKYAGGTLKKDAHSVVLYIK